MKSSKRSFLSRIGAVIAAISAVGRMKHGKQRSSKVLASTPTDLGWRGWKRALIETKNAIGNKRLGMLASSVAYGGTLAFFPLVVACVAIASMVMSPDQIRDAVANISAYLPSDIAGLLSAQLVNAMGKHSANLIVAISAIAIALFGVSGAMNSLVSALNSAYGCKETRGMVKSWLVSVGLTCMLVLAIVIALPAIALGSGLLERFGVPAVIVTVFSVLRWLILAAVMTLGLAVIYRYAPDRPNVRWQWVSWGAVMATLLWLAVTVLFFVYVQYFANFSQSYSLFAGIIVLMTWLNYTGLVVLVGAEVNHQLEKVAAAK